MRHRFLPALLVGLLFAPAATAAELPFDAKLSIQFLTIPPLESQVVSRAGGVSFGPGGSLDSLALSVTPATISASVGVGPLGSSWTPIDGLFGTFGLVPFGYPLQTFARNTGGRIAGAVPLLGVVRVCLFAPTGACPGSPTGDVFIPLMQFTQQGYVIDRAIGWGGSWFGPAGGGVNLTVRGAPWTTGTAAAGTLSAMGFAMGPASQPGTTARAGGRLNLVTPIFISTSLPAVPLFPGIATLDVTFTADPPECDNGIDDDGDGYVDYASDPVCQSDPTFTREFAQCQDGVDNDSDGNVDYDGGASIFGAPIGPPDAVCSGPRKNRENAGGCGIGAELALALAGLRLLRRR